jgi:2-isopropylmalate synthase
MRNSGSSELLTNSDRLVVVDTSLRTWEGSNDSTITSDFKLRAARGLAEVGVDIIEAGMPATSASSFATVSMVAREVRGPVVGGLASCNRAAIELTAKALKAAPRRRIHVLLSMGPVLEAPNSSIEKDLLCSVVQGIQLARDLETDVEFSAADVMSSDWAFLAQVFESALEAGASTLNISDSTGTIVPEEVSELIRYVRRYVRGIHRARLSMRCGNQFGTAMANSLAAIIAGARQVVCTLTETPSAAGSCSLEGLIAILEMREAFFHVTTGVHLTNLLPIPARQKDLVDLIEQCQASSQPGGEAGSMSA